MSGKTASTSPQFPGFAKKKMQKIAREATNLYKDPTTEFLPELNARTNQGLDMRAEIAGGGNSIANPALDEARKILSGGYLDVTKDPNFQRNINEALGSTAGRFANSGRTGSGAYAGAMSDAATGVAAQMYDVERQRQMQTLGMTPQLIAGQYADSAALEDAGRAVDEDTMARFDWPYARLDRYANTIYGSPATQIPGQTSRQPFDWGNAALGTTMGLLSPLSKTGSY